MGGLVLVAALAAGVVFAAFGRDDGAGKARRAAPPRAARLPDTAAPRLPSRTYTVGEVRERFRKATGLRLVVFRDATTDEVTSLRSSPHLTPRFGEFQIFVFRPGVAARMTRVFTSGVPADGRGVHWVDDRVGGWIAVTVHGRNLVVGWFPTEYGSHRVDARWRRLQAVVRRLQR